MADDALKCIKVFLDSVPAWTADIETILSTATARQNEVLFEQQPTDLLFDQARQRASASSSPCSRPSDGAREEEEGENEQSESQAPLLRPQLPHLIHSDALRLSQRKRKTASVCSGDPSGPFKYRSRAMVVVYYDGDTQKRFETLVGAIGVGRNAVRKGKNGTAMNRLSCTRSSSSEDGSSTEEGTLDLSKLQYRSTRPPRGGSKNEEGMEGFEMIDGCLERSQSLCERAAHQILRDGDCALELNNAKEQLAEAKKVAEGVLPKLEERTRQPTDRQRKREERQRVKDAAEEKEQAREQETKQAESAPAASPVPSLVSSLPSDGRLEVDLEADDSDDDTADFAADALQLGKHQMRSARLMAH